MNQIEHIQQNRQNLDVRWRILQYIREFFWTQEFVEVETPLALAHAGQEPYLSPIPVLLHNENGEAKQTYLHTSPEYAMKKMLAAGYENIFSITKCFRDYESFGGLHNPEFTMLEFYEVGGDVKSLMEMIEALLVFLSEKLEMGNLKWEITGTSMKELWRKMIEVDLDAYLDEGTMRQLCIDKGYTPAEDERYEDLFYRIFLNEIEPQLKDMGVVMVYGYPAQMSALARLSDEDTRYADRVEVYVNGIELANGFAELTDGTEQRRRFEDEQQIRKVLGKPVYPIDEAFIAAVHVLPNCAGIAVGVDRLVQAFVGCQSIDDVLVLPMSKQ